MKKEIHSKKNKEIFIRKIIFASKCMFSYIQLPSGMLKVIKFRFFLNVPLSYSIVRLCVFYITDFPHSSNFDAI